MRATAQEKMLSEEYKKNMVRINSRGIYEILYPTGKKIYSSCHHYKFIENKVKQVD